MWWENNMCRKLVNIGLTYTFQRKMLQLFNLSTLFEFHKFSKVSFHIIFKKMSIMILETVLHTHTHYISSHIRSTYFSQKIPRKITLCLYVHYSKPLLFPLYSIGVMQVLLKQLLPMNLFKSGFNDYLPSHHAMFIYMATLYISTYTLSLKLISLPP